MSKSQELIAKQHPVSAGDILGMVASEKVNELGLTEAAPPTIQ